jgi:hypothetical protein
MFITCQHVEVETNVGMEETHAMRMVGYLQNINGSGSGFKR